MARAQAADQLSFVPIADLNVLDPFFARSDVTGLD